MAAGAPAVFGMAEVQGHQVVDDLLRLPALQGRYEAISTGTGDHRGFQPVLFYDSEILKLEGCHFPKPAFPEAGRYRFREFIQAKFSLQGNFFQAILLHFPSKRNRDRHRHLRQEGWVLLRQILMETESPVEKTFILGDFNEDFLSTQTQENFSGLFNLSPDFLFAKSPTAFHHGRGVVCDHIFCFNHRTQRMENLENHRLIFPELLMTDRTTLARPKPMYAGTRYFGGLSDHFPIIAATEIVPPKTVIFEQNFCE